MNDLELINRILAGDTLKFNQLIRNWEKRIYSFVFRYMGNRDDAMDITQKTFMNTYRYIGNLKDPARFSSWIYQIATNLCRDESVRVKRRSMVPLDSLHEENEKSRRTQELAESYEGQPDTRLGTEQVKDYKKGRG